MSVAHSTEVVTDESELVAGHHSRKVSQEIVILVLPRRIICLSHRRLE